MSGTKTQPSRVDTQDTPPDRPENVITSETPPESVEEQAAATDTGSAQKTGDPAPPETDNKPQPKKKRNRSQERRFKRVHRDLQRANSRIDELEATIAELREGDQAPPPPPKPKAEPKITDFDTPQDYAKAYAKWESDSKPEPKPKPKPKPAQPAADESPIDEDARTKFVTLGKEKLGDDFQEAITDSQSFGVSKVMGEFILDSELGPELFCYLHANPDEAADIYRQSSPKAIKSLKGLQKRIETAGTWDIDPADDGEQDPEPESEETPATPPRASKAPPAPPEPDKGTVVPDADLEKADMDNYAATRRAQIKKRRGSGW